MRSDRNEAVRREARSRPAGGNVRASPEPAARRLRGGGALLIALLLSASVQACSKDPVGPETPQQPQQPQTPQGPAAVASVAVLYVGDSLVMKGRTAALTVSVKDADGNALTDRTVTWSSTDDAVAGVAGTDVGAVVTAHAAGAVEITATVEGVAGSADLRVADTDAAGLAQLAEDAFGRALASKLQDDGAALPGILDDIVAALDQENLSAIRDGLAAARNAIDAPSAPDDVVLYAVVGLFLDHLERFLNL